MRVPKWLGIELVEISTKEKLIAAIGSSISIGILIGFSFWALPISDAISVIGSMGASAVLLFAVPHGPLSQPWPALMGHAISAIIGVTCAKYIPQQQFSAACAVGLSIGAMLQLRCIHPPGGATAFAAVMGGAEIRNLGYLFVLFPVLANVTVMIILALIINSPFKWRRYPASLNARRELLPAVPAEPSTTIHQEILTAIRTLDSFVDISEEDLIYLSKLLSHHAELASNKPRSSRPL